MLPYYGEHLCVKAGANFLKALQEKPKFVCTCCHHMLFHKTVKPFKLTDFDMGNDIVQKCLSHRYVMKVHKHNKHPSNNEQTSHEWPTIHSANQDAEVVYMDEFICTHCHNSLQQKKPKMPDQACVNSLKLDQIPQDLEMLLTIERQIISLQIPFITIIAMRRYGGHYKISASL